MNRKEIFFNISGGLIGAFLLLSFVIFLEKFNSNPSIFCLRFTILPIIIGTIIGVLITIVLNQNNKLKKINKKLKYYSNTDTLTNTISRRSGLEILKKELNKTKRLKKKLIIAFIDINKLKIVNDKYGHHEGDKYLIQINKIIKKTLRNTEYIIRIGGDEFLIIFDNKNSVESVETIFTRITRKIENYNKRNIKPYKMGFCYGISTYNYKENINLVELLKKADKNMYKQKNKLKKIN